MSLSGKDIAEIARLLDHSRFSDLKLEIGDFRLRIRRDGSRGYADEEFEERPAPKQASAKLEPAAATKPRSGEVDVPAPLLGVFYHAPRPGDAPFVTVGQQVTETSIIGIIEVMKLMNSVRAGVSGTVVAILAPNAEAVEAGQPLIRVAP